RFSFTFSSLNGKPETALSVQYVNKHFNMAALASLPRLNLEDLDDWQCEKNFRFNKNDMSSVFAALRIPEYYQAEQRTKASGMEALMILLRRLAYPNRSCDLILDDMVPPKNIFIKSPQQDIFLISSKSMGFIWKTLHSIYHLSRPNDLRLETCALISLQCECYDSIRM
ncbi:Hypothetical predicted protein, partial [Paramuricea clavata]